MAIRLNKASRELNIGISIAAEFLSKKGQPLQDVSPITKITDEQYLLLQEEFSHPQIQHSFMSNKNLKVHLKNRLKKMKPQRGRIF